MSRTKAEVQQIEADAAWWNELADKLGWQLHGFTFREHASFVTSAPSLASINGTEREDIMRAIADAGKAGSDA